MVSSSTSRNGGSVLLSRLVRCTEKGRPVSVGLSTIPLRSLPRVASLDSVHTPKAPVTTIPVVRSTRPTPEEKVLPLYNVGDVET